MYSPQFVVDDLAHGAGAHGVEARVRPRAHEAAEVLVREGRLRAAGETVGGEGDQPGRSKHNNGDEVIASIQL